MSASLLNGIIMPLTASETLHTFILKRSMPHTLQPPSSRRGFLGRLAAGAAALTLAGNPFRLDAAGPGCGFSVLNRNPIGSHIRLAILA